MLASIQSNGGPQLPVFGEKPACSQYCPNLTFKQVSFTGRELRNLDEFVESDRIWSLCRMRMVTFLDCMSFYFS